jgi:hypothetical protein
MEIIKKVVIPSVFKITNAGDINDATKMWVGFDFVVIQSHPIASIGDTVKLTFNFNIKTITVTKI